MLPSNDRDRPPPASEFAPLILWRRSFPIPIQSAHVCVVVRQFQCRSRHSRESLKNKKQECLDEVRELGARLQHS